jgi:protein-disulfide isomerase
MVDRRSFMAVSIHHVSRYAVAVALIFVLGPQSWAFAQKGAKISVAGYPSMKKGSPDLVFIEVSDFQCPYCRQGAREVLPKVFEKFVDTGKVELVYLAMPLEMHSQAFRAAQVAACADDQKRFWDMHHLLFADRGDFAPARISEYAGELELDMPAFQKCLSSRQHDGEIRKSIRVAQNLGINSTPFYLLGRRIPGSEKVQILDFVKGAWPYEEFEKKIDALLASK